MKVLVDFDYFFEYFLIVLSVACELELVFCLAGAYGFDC